MRRRPTAPGLAARDFVDTTLRKVSLETDLAGRIPAHIVKQMRQIGYFGLTIPDEYGGVGLGLVDYLDVVRELARTNLAFQELTEENNGIGSAALLNAGTDEQKKRWLPRLASGEILGSFAVTEPDAGSDVAGIKMTARRVVGGYRLNGTKHFITHGGEAGLITVVARLQSEKQKEFGLFLVTPDMEGFHVARLQPMMGYRASGQAELVFNDVFVPDEGVVGEASAGFQITMRTLDRGRLTVSADCLGAAEEMLDRSIAYAKERFTFGRALATRGEVRAMIAQSAIDLFCVESALYDFAQLSENGHDIREATARLKLFASETAFSVTDRALQIHGGAGYTTESEIERHFRDLRVMRIAEGASEVMRATIARGIRRVVRDLSSERLAIRLIDRREDSSDGYVGATNALLRSSEEKLLEQAKCDLDSDRALSEMRDARLADQASQWTMIDSATRRLHDEATQMGKTEAIEMASLGVLVAARRLAGAAIEGARMAAIASGTPRSYRPETERLEGFDMEFGTTDQMLDRVARGLLG